MLPALALILLGVILWLYVSFILGIIIIILGLLYLFTAIPRARGGRYYW